MNKRTEERIKQYRAVPRKLLSRHQLNEQDHMQLLMAVLGKGSRAWQASGSCAMPLTDQLCDECLAIFEDLLADATLEGPAGQAFVDCLLDLLCERCRPRLEAYL